MSAHLAAFGAVLFSICTVFGCIFYIPLVWQNGDSLIEEVKNDLKDFEVNSDENK